MCEDKDADEGFPQILVVVGSRGRGLDSSLVLVVQKVRSHSVSFRLPASSRFRDEDTDVGFSTRSLSLSLLNTATRTFVTSGERSTPLSILPTAGRFKVSRQGY